MKVKEAGEYSFGLGARLLQIPVIILHISCIKVKIRLHTKKQLPRLPESAKTFAVAGFIIHYHVILEGVSSSSAKV